eukprot:758225-Hanusia_phi.AAC.1
MTLTAASIAVSVYLTASFKQDLNALLGFLVLTVASAWAVAILPICFQVRKSPAPPRRQDIVTSSS